MLSNDITIAVVIPLITWVAYRKWSLHLSLKQWRVAGKSEIGQQTSQSCSQDWLLVFLLGPF